MMQPENWIERSIIDLPHMAGTTNRNVNIAMERFEFSSSPNPLVYRYLFLTFAGHVGVGVEVFGGE
jgi:hypothetical protein